MGNWAELSKEVEGMLRLRTFPLAWKRLSKKEELDKIPRVRHIEHPITFCQAFTLARTAGWTVGATAADMEWCGFKNICGLARPTEEELSGVRRAGYWLKTPDDAQKQAQAMYRIPAGDAEAIVLAPLASEKFEPDVIMIYGNPAQLMMFCCGLQWTDYSRLDFTFVGETACSDSVARCYVTGKPSLTLPCYGERRLGHVQDDELVIAIPPNQLGKAIDGLKGLWAVGLRYPIPFYGAEADNSPTLARAYGPEALAARKKASG